jgi:DNA-binding MurR/RpiR family transcriptional regulator
MQSGKSIAMLLKIEAKKPSLSKSERRVCDYIIQHPEEIIYLSVSELAERSGVSDATVIRARQKLGSKS